jgi:glycolate oxidase FAD binding subunit
MRELIKAQTPEQVLDAVQWALSDTPKTLEVTGLGSKQGLGTRTQTDGVLDLSGLSGIQLYEPEELVMSARAGTPVGEILAALAEANQMMAFEPWSPKGLYGTNDGTIGGLFAAAQAGPRRPLAGAARDHLLGFHAVSGRGEAFKSGGRVVKNVTGFDLSKLMAGSMGSLAVLTDVAFKVLPKPEKSRTILLLGAVDFGQAMRTAQNSPYEVSGVAHLPFAIAQRSEVSYVSAAGTSVTAVRVEGPGPSVEARCQALKTLLSPFGAVEELHTTNTETLWREIRDVRFFADEQPLWRLSVPPTSGPDIAKSLRGEHFFDWAGGLIWLSSDSPQDVRQRLDGGHATLMRAPEGARSDVPVFQPPADGVAALMGRVKDAFDPRAILNPNRL